MNQCDAILRELRKGPLTPMDALSKLGCFRLAARIYDLRERGHVIHTVEWPVSDKRVARYHLVREAR